MVNEIGFPIHIFRLFPTGRKGHFSTVMARHCSVDFPSSGSTKYRIYGLTFCPGSTTSYPRCAISHSRFKTHFFLSLNNLILHGLPNHRQSLHVTLFSPITREISKPKHIGMWTRCRSLKSLEIILYIYRS